METETENSSDLKNKLSDKNGRRHTGQSGEDRACKYLAEKGYNIVARNFRERFGEIDIIAEKNETLVIVEVKTFPNANLDMLRNVLDRRKQNKIIKTCKCFLLKHRQYSKDFIRFDVVIIDMPEFGPVYHIENAFSELL